MDVLIEASAIAERAHKGQMRKHLDEPYFAHPTRVAARATDYGLPVEAIAAAWVHDVVEDCDDWTFARLKAEAMPRRTVVLARLLTKWWIADEDSGLDVVRLFKPVYYAAIAQDPDATDLKILDRTDNLTDMVKIVDADSKWARAYMGKTQEEFPSLLAVSRRPGVVAAYFAALATLQRALEENAGR